MPRLRHLLGPTRCESGLSSDCDDEGHQSVSVEDGEALGVMVESAQGL